MFYKLDAGLELETERELERPRQKVWSEAVMGKDQVIHALGSS